MRKIKFRAWTDKGGMITPCLWLDKYNHFVGEDYTNNQYGNVLDVMEFTGLHDKNGREIWQGDIINGSIRGGKNVIIFDNELAAFGYRYKTNWGLSFEFLYRNLEDIEIIGNIYENPDLLGVKKCL